MRRADRLMRLVHFLRRRHRAVTAKRIAEEFDICTRTVYRDIQDLMNSGVPISGEAGVGYVINKQYYLPPITFDIDELEAISLGISMVRQWTDQRFAAKASNAFEKIQAAVPGERMDELRQITTYAMSSQQEIPWTISFSGLRECIRARYKIRIEYIDAAGQSTTRTIRPLALFFFSPRWVLAGWCEKRNDFRAFRLDRIGTLENLQQHFDEEEGRNLVAYLEAESACGNIIMG